MFLGMLEEEQKELFLDLAIKAAASSGGIAIEEKNMLKSFAKELQIPPKYQCRKRVTGIIDRLKAISDEKSLRIVMFEILAEMYSDSEYDETERQFIATMAESFNISQDTVNEMDSLLKRYAKLYRDICELVLKV